MEASYNESLNGSNGQDQDDLMTFYSKENELLMGISFLSLAVIGCIGNTYTILVMLFRQRLYNCCTPYLISVSISDLVMTAVILPVVGANAVTGKVFAPTLLCKWLSIFYHNMLATSWLGLAMVSVIRCAGIWTNNNCCLLRWTGRMISLTWLLPIVTNTYFVYLRWGSTEHIRTGYICWYFCGIRHMLEHDHEDTHSVFWLSTIYSIFPLAIMIISYSMIVFKVRQSNLTLKMHGGMTFNKHKNEVRFTRMIGIIFINYILFTFLPAILLIFRATPSHDFVASMFKPELNNDEIVQLRSKVISSVDPYVYILFFTPFVSNPFIYVFSNKSYRKAYHDFLLKNVIPKLRSVDERSKSLHLEQAEARFN